MTTAGKIITGFVALLFIASVAVIGAIVGIAVCEKMYLLLTTIPFGILSMSISGKILFDIFETYIEGIRGEE